jgi:acyl-CoA reductase-like NAD-dependent aldehyde dehydrogenase
MTGGVSSVTATAGELKMSRAVESGIVTVNNLVISDPRVPFGGIKNSDIEELSKPKCILEIYFVILFLSNNTS